FPYTTLFRSSRPAFYRIQKLLLSLQSMLLSEDVALFFAPTNIFCGVRIQGLRDLVDRLLKFLDRGLQFEILLLQQRGYLFGGVGTAGEHRFHNDARILNDMLLRVI